MLVLSPFARIACYYLIQNYDASDQEGKEEEEGGKEEEDEVEERGLKETGTS